MTSQVRPGVGILFKNFQELCQICMRKLLLVQQVNDWWVAHDGVLEVCYVALLLLLLLLLLTFFLFSFSRATHYSEVSEPTRKRQLM